LPAARVAGEDGDGVVVVGERFGGSAGGEGSGTVEGSGVAESSGIAEGCV
jgi:hypothetical protein